MCLNRNENAHSLTQRSSSSGEAYKFLPQRSHVLEAWLGEVSLGFVFFISGKSSSRTSRSAFKPSWSSSKLLF